MSEFKYLQYEWGNFINSEICIWNTCKQAVRREKIRSTEHWLKLERWQGPPHINKVKHCITVLSFKVSLLISHENKESLFISCEISVKEDVLACTYSYNNVTTSVGQVTTILLVELLLRYYCLCRVICHWLLSRCFSPTQLQKHN